MRFESELDQESIPEWKAKYFDYKLGKRKIRACVKAIEKANRTPTTPRFRRTRGSSVPRQPPSAPSAFRPRPPQDDATQNQATNIKDNRLTAGLSTETGGWGSEAIKALQSKFPASSETQPLKSPRRGDQSGSYGSIEPAPRPGPGVKLQNLDEGALDTVKSKISSGSKSGSPGTQKSGSWLWRARSKSVSMGPPVLKLPEPALGSDQGEYDIRGPEVITRPNTERSDADTSPVHERSNNLQFRTAARPQRSLTSPFTPVRRPTLFKRIMSTYSYRGPSAGVLGVPLEAYHEFDACQAEFFHFLDEELEKVEEFYKEKEEEANQRIETLKEQLQMMKIKQAEETRRDRAANPFRSTTNGHTGSSTGADASSKWLRRITRGSKSNQEQLFSDAPQGNNVNTSHNNGGDALDGQRDVNEVKYSQAKSILKHALQEFYKILEMLKSYAMVNRTAFRKINKKYDKAIGTRRGKYMSEKVDRAWFVQSSVLESHLEDVENLYAQYFEKGSHKAAVKKLRAKHQTDYSSNSFRTGLLLGAGTVLGVRAMMYASQIYTASSPIVTVQTKYLLQIYGGYFLALLLVLLFCLDCKLWLNQKINYVFIFEFDRRHNLDWRQLAELPSLLWFLFGLIMWLNFNPGGVDYMYIYWPIVLIAVTAALLFSPIKMLYYQSRLWWAISNFRLFSAGWYPVEFRDFLLGDMYCSLAYTMGNIELFFCFYTICWYDQLPCNDSSVCGSSNSRLLGFFSCLPGIWRFLQCFRRYRDTRMAFPHIYNSGKYLCTILYYMSLSLYRIQRASNLNPTLTGSLKGLFIFFGIINSIYVSLWDLLIDWSLGHVHCEWPLLRDPLGFSWPPMYYIAMVVDPILRFSWLLYVIVPDELQQSALLSFLISLSEIFRRAFWAAFRVENEHMTNVGMFRASKDLPLPFEVPSVRTSMGTVAEEQEDPNTEIEAQSNPIARPAISTPKRVGTTIATAHAQDFQRRRPEESSSDEDDEGNDSDREENERNEQMELGRVDGSWL